MSFPDRFELLDLLHEGDVRTYRARERATGRTIEVHFALSPDQLADMQGVIDRGTHEGKSYVVTALAEATPLDSAGAWRIKPQATTPQAPAAPPAPGSEPGDFTRMFQLRQAPDSVAAPVSKPAPASISTSQPGEFTRAFQRPSTAPVAPTDASAPGQPGEFTRMFQKPVSPPSGTLVPENPGTPSQPRRTVIVIALVILSAVAVFLLVRTLY